MPRLVLILTVLSTFALTSVDALAQRGGFRGGFAGGPGGGFGVGGLLMSEQVRGEIELLPDQEEELRALGEDTRDRMRDLFSGMRDLPREERRAAFEDARAGMEEIRQDVESQVKEVLMPHQFERLKQIEVQQQMARGGTASVAQGQLAEQLGLTDQQKEEMQQKAQEAQRDLQEKITQLRLEARESILSVLTSEQRAKFDQLVGKPFEMDQRGAGRGQRGFREGSRGNERRGERSAGRAEVE